jgi:hypothetical protein
MVGNILEEGRISLKRMVYLDFLFKGVGNHAGLNIMLNE